MRAGLVIAIFLLVCAMPHPVAAKGIQDDIEGALTFLAEQRTDGHFDATFAPLAAEAALQAGHSISEWPSRASPVQSDLQLRSNTSALLPLLRSALVLGRADGARHPEAAIPQRILAFQRNGQFGEPSLLNDDIWATMTLRAWGFSDQNGTVRQTVSYLIARQGTDGGWSWRLDGPTDVDTTGMALTAIKGVENSESALARGGAFLQSTQVTAGGFPTQLGAEANCDSTVWALRGLVAVGKPMPPDALAFLARLHRSDGGYAYMANEASNPFCTAEVAAWLAQAQTEGLDLTGYAQTHGTSAPPILALGSVMIVTAVCWRRLRAA